MPISVRRVGEADLETCFEIRREVFVRGQGVSLEIEIDGLDAEAVQFLARSGRQAVGTARMRVVGGQGKAERVAVLAAWRRHGVGRLLMHALEEDARARGLSGVTLHAQVEAIPFYEALGYAATGAEFAEAGIPHRSMERSV